MLESNDNKFILKSSGTGKFGRVLGEIFIPPVDDDQIELELINGTRYINVNQKMIEEGHAVAYFGGSKQEVKDALMVAREKSKEYVEKNIEPL